MSSSGCTTPDAYVANIEAAMYFNEKILEGSVDVIFNVVVNFYYD